MQASLIDYCLVCDDLRLETGNKASILGFYGMLPNVRMIVEDWGKPLDRMTFLVSTHGITKPYAAQLKIISPDDSILSVGNVVNVTPVHDNISNSAIGFGFPMLILREQGKYRVEVTIDGVKSYESTFLVQSSRPTVKV